jgi:hypothetical protein
MEQPRHRSQLIVALGLFAVTSCRDQYRIGDYVWVEWDGRDYPAYVVDRKDKARFRVHFDGYESRWDEDVTLERIKGRVEGPVSAPPPPDKVARAMGMGPKPSASARALSSFIVGDRLRVRWRGSLYAATFQALAGPGKSSGSLRGVWNGMGRGRRRRPSRWKAVTPWRLYARSIA